MPIVSSQMEVSCAMKSGARWQFCRTTHPPDHDDDDNDDDDDDDYVGVE